MPQVSHQTIALGKGKHHSPAQGACVMELASMLAGEPFSDHPISVCPVIASLLRAYNDAVDDEHRQDLYRFAAASVGTRASDEVRNVRAGRLAAWTAERRARRGLRAILPPGLRGVGLRRKPAIDAAGTTAVRSISRHDETSHHEVLALVEQLIAIGAPPEVTVLSQPAELPTVIA